MNIAEKSILIKSKKLVFGENFGENITSQKGDGYDFCELREYETTDDAKKIDWILSAKHSKPIIKIFNEQKDLNIAIVLLLGGSMHFGTDEFKSEKAILLASILAFLAVRQNDIFWAFVAQNQLNLVVKQAKNINNAKFLVDKLTNTKCVETQVDYKQIYSKLLKSLPKKSLVFLIGDFLESDTLGFDLLSKKYEIFALIVRDRFEEDPKFAGDLSLCDNENGVYFGTNFDDVWRKSYKNEISKNDAKLYEKLHKCGAKFAKFYTNEDEIKPLRKLLG